MPRNGDGSSDNGPIEGQELLHGASGDKTLQHTKHVAPMPEVEAGDALPGMGAGGAAAPIADNAEEFGVNEPKKDPLDDDEDDISTSSSKGQEMDARAQRVADAVGKSKGAGDEVVRKNGGHADVEELHGATSLESGDRSMDGKSGGAKKGGQDEKS